MPALDYTDLAAMGTLVSELHGLSTAPSDQDSVLIDSAGTHTAGGTTVYRPYLAAALILERALNTRRLREADGAVFDRASTTIRNLKAQQSRRDELLADTYGDWEIPEGYEATRGNRATILF